jgi:hypothetical protein
MSTNVRLAFGAVFCLAVIVVVFYGLQLAIEAPT